MDLDLHKMLSSYIYLSYAMIGGVQSCIVFGKVVAVAFQIAFRAEKHVNNVFLFFKNYF